MIDVLKKYLSPLLEAADKRPRPDPVEDTRLAVCVLLLEIAGSDYEFSPQEKETVQNILVKNLGVAPGEVEQLIEAAEQERAGSVGLFEYTRLINREYSIEKKKELMEMFWQIIYADGILDPYEDHLVHKLSDLLHLEHEDFIAAKLNQKPAE